jgi:hypothetical protein
MFLITLLVWIVGFTVFESALVGRGLSPTAERWLVAGTLVLPSVIGMALGAIGLVRAQQRRGWALVGLILNTLAAIFFASVLAFAG